jgi:hypothetical protein
MFVSRFVSDRVGRVIHDHVRQREKGRESARDYEKGRSGRDISHVSIVLLSSIVITVPERRALGKLLAIEFFMKCRDTSLDCV